MLNNDGYFVIEHDTTLMVVAAGICLLATLASVGLFDHARASGSRTRAIWLAVAALAGGTGIWATHFFAKLAVVTGLSSGYSVAAMACALVIAVSFTAASFVIALGARGHLRALAGGAVLGLGIVAMHRCGMAAYNVAGLVEWNPAVVALAAALGLGLAAVARAILELGRGLDLPILAEGVETDAELAFLGSEFCHEVQGYLLGRPAPIESFGAHTGLDIAGAGASPDAARDIARGNAGRAAA